MALLLSGCSCIRKWLSHTSFVEVQRSFKNRGPTPQVVRKVWICIRFWHIYSVCKFLLYLTCFVCSGLDFVTPPLFYWFRKNLQPTLSEASWDLYQANGITPQKITVYSHRCENPKSHNKSFEVYNKLALHWVHGNAFIKGNCKDHVYVVETVYACNQRGSIQMVVALWVRATD